MTRFGALAAIHLCAWHYEGRAAVATARLAALVRAGFLRVVVPRFAGRTVYLATAAGSRAGSAGLRPARFVPALATHHLAVADVAAALLRAYPGATWIAERELRREARAEPGRRDYAGHPPDGALTLGQRRLAVEVELTAKSPASYRRILRWYAGALEFAAVVWFCPQDGARRHVAARLRDVIEREGLTDVATVRPLPPGVDAAPWG